MKSLVRRLSAGWDLLGRREAVCALGLPLRLPGRLAILLELLSATWASITAAVAAVLPLPPSAIVRRNLGVFIRGENPIVPSPGF